MDTVERNTAKHFALQLGSLVSLYLSITFFLVLVFGFINLRFPDPIDSAWAVEQAASNIRLGFAFVLVFFPTYLVLTRIVNQNRRDNDDSNYLGLTKWLIYLSLLIGGGVLLGDLVAIIIAFLEGEITTRFILKALAVFMVTGLAFLYYVQDARGYWLHKERASAIYAGATLLAVGLMLLLSIAFIETPSEVREARLDQEMLNDLQDIQWRVFDYYNLEGELPENLTEVYGQLPLPMPPAGRAPYSYSTTSDNTFELCTVFVTDATAPERYSYVPRDRNYNWQHTAGEWCFERTAETQKLP